MSGEFISWLIAADVIFGILWAYSLQYQISSELLFTLWVVCVAIYILYLFVGD